MNIRKGQGVPDFIMLENIDTNAFMKNLLLRYRVKQIYTNFGEHLVVMNPYEDMNELHNDKTLLSYKDSQLGECQPHIFALANHTYEELLRQMKDQAVIITGESGSGKTESAKLLVKYFAHPGIYGACNVEGIQKKMIGSCTIFQAFGNSKTIINENSSRFARFMEIKYDKAGVPLGGKVKNFHLEMNRVVRHQEEFPKDAERNFHIFYMLLSQERLVEKLRLEEDPSKYDYLKTSTTSLVNLDDKKEFLKLSAAMDDLDFSENVKTTIWKALAAILFLGNIKYDTVKIQKQDGCQVVGRKEVQEVALLLGVLEPELKKTLTTRTMTSGLGLGKTSSIQIPFSAIKARSTRDTFCKTLYQYVYDLIASTVNNSLAVQSEAKTMSIAIVEAQGFEVFQKNSFDQFCINFCDEKLQHLCNTLTFETEKEQYKNEDIDWKDVEYANNASIISLSEGMFKTLDNFPSDQKPEDYVTKISQQCGSNENFEAVDPRTFRILHYVSKVEYDTTNFLSENQNIVFDTFDSLLSESRDPMISKLIPSAKKRRQKKPTIGKTLVKTVNGLLKRIKQCQPRYIRCIKPNDKLQSFGLDEDRVRSQVHSLNLVPLACVRKAGFCTPQTYESFLQRYSMICEETWIQWKLSPKGGVRTILESLEDDGVEEEDFQMGRTKVFIHSIQTFTLLEKKRKEKLPGLVTLIQKTFRGWSTRRRLDKTKLAQLIQKLFRGFRERSNFKEYRAAIMIQKYWKGYSIRKYVKNNRKTIIQERDAERMLRATIKVQRRIICWLNYRFVKALRDMFVGANTKEHNWGKQLKFVRPVTTGSERAKPILERMRYLHWGREKINSLGSAYGIMDMRRKVVTMELFEPKKKPWNCNRRYKGDYLNTSGKPNQKYESAIKDLFQSTSDKEIVFSDTVTKVNRKNKTQDQLLVITDQNIYRYDSKNIKMLKEGLSLAMVQEVIMSPFNDSWVIIKMQSPARDMILDLGVSGEEHASELATMLYIAVQRSVSKEIPVIFKETIVYDNGRTEKGPGKPVTLTFVHANDAGKKGKVLGFAAGKGNTARVIYK